MSLRLKRKHKHDKLATAFFQTSIRCEIPSNAFEKVVALVHALGMQPQTQRNGHWILLDVTSMDNLSKHVRPNCGTRPCALYESLDHETVDTSMQGLFW